MEGTIYRSFNRPFANPLAQPPATSQGMQQRTSERRRSSTDSGGRSHWESGNASGDTFFSAVSTYLLGSDSIPPNFYSVDTAGPAAGTQSAMHSAGRPPRHGAESVVFHHSGSFPPAHSPSSQSMPNKPRTWSASDRARRVAQDAYLLDLLHSEIEKAGVVTAAGFRAVHQNFLYSEAVEHELIRAAMRPEKRSSRFGSLFNSIGNAASNAHFHGRTPSLAVEGVAKKLILKSGGASSESRNDNGNLAPRRTSQVRDLTKSQYEEMLKLKQEHRDQEQRKLMMASFEATLDRSEIDNFDRSCFLSSDDNDDLSKTDGDIVKHSSTARSFRHRRQGSNDSLDLQDIFDGADGSNLLSSMLSLADGGGTLSEKKLSSGKFASLSRLGRLSSCFNDVNFDSDTNEAGVEEDVDDDEDGLISSCTDDNCGWLPWPKSKCDDSQGSDQDQDTGDLLESFRSSFVEGDDSFLPWPAMDCVLNNNRARAA